MNRQEAERFEEALQGGTEGEPLEGRLASLVETARQAQGLAGPVPPPPHRLAPGRQRLLAEAARLRAETKERRKEQRWMTGVMKLGTALIALILVSGLVFGAGQVMAGSLPGEPLYNLKLTAEEIRLALTTAPEARADLTLTLAEERIDEVTTLLEQNRPVDDATAARVQQQLEVALETAVQQQNAAAAGTLQQLALAIQQRQRTMEKLMAESPQPPMRQLLRVMEQVREEAHAGAGDPAGLRQRLRYGMPAVPTVIPSPSHTPVRGEPQQTGQPGPQGPQPTVEPGSGPGPGPQPTMEPGGGPGPGPQPTMEPGRGPGPGPQPTMEPGGDGGPGSQPGSKPGGGPGEPVDGPGKNGSQKP
jgi:hypothetical protein